VRAGGLCTELSNVVAGLPSPQPSPKGRGGKKSPTLKGTPTSITFFRDCPLALDPFGLSPSTCAGQALSKSFLRQAQDDRRCGLRANGLINNPGSYTQSSGPVLLPLPLGEGRGEGWRSVHRAIECCGWLALTPTLSQRARGQEKPNIKKDTHVNYVYPRSAAVCRF
jgi:hypothetical protein